MMRVKLMTGTMFRVSRLNVSAVVRYIASKGWTVVRGPQSHLAEAASEDEPRDVPVATFKKGGLTVDLPTTFLARIAHEYRAAQHRRGIRCAVGCGTERSSVNVDQLRRRARPLGLRPRRTIRCRE